MLYRCMKRFLQMNWSDKYKSEVLNEYNDMAVVISSEKRCSGLCEGESGTQSIFYKRRLLFWSAPESEEDMSLDCIYEKNPCINIISFITVMDKYDIPFFAVANAYNESMEDEELWQMVPKNLCKKIADLLSYTGDVIKNNAVNDGEVILWSRLMLTT